MYQYRGAFAFAGFFRTDHDPPGELFTLFYLRPPATSR